MGIVHLIDEVSSSSVAVSYAISSPSSSKVAGMPTGSKAGSSFSLDIFEVRGDLGGLVEDFFDR
jgi:hypothetical protein